MPKVNGAFRSKRGFTAVDNAIIRDRTVSLKAKGLYLVIQSYITNPTITCTKAFLLSTCLEGEKSFNSSWDELKERGYLRVHFHVEKGRKGFISEYELLDAPTDGPHTFYYDAEGNVTHTNLTKYGKANRPEEAKTEENERTPRNGIYVDSTYVESTFVKRSYADGADNINIYTDSTENKDDTVSHPEQYSDPEGNQSISQSKNGTDRSTDVFSDYDRVEEMIKDNVDYGHILVMNDHYDRRLGQGSIDRRDYEEKYIQTEIADRIIRYMTDAYCAGRDVMISGMQINAEALRARIMKIDNAQFIEAYRKLKQKYAEVTNKKAYTLSVLFNG